MLYVRIENGLPVEWPVQDFQIKSRLKNVSFPRRSGLDAFAPYGYEAFSAVKQPEFDSRLDQVLEATPVKIEGAWVQQWSVQSLFETEEQRAAKKAEIDEADRQALLATQQEVIRTERNRLLTQSDWTQLPDAGTDSAAWATYRQALRDIPQQAGFPDRVTWPTKPE